MEETERIEFPENPAEINWTVEKVHDLRKAALKGQKIPDAVTKSALEWIRQSRVAEVQKKKAGGGKAKTTKVITDLDVFLAGV